LIKKTEALAVKSATHTQTQVIVGFFFGACRIEALLDHIILPTKQKKKHSVYHSIAKSTYRIYKALCPRANPSNSF